MNFKENSLLARWGKGGGRTGDIRVTYSEMFPMGD